MPGAHSTVGLEKQDDDQSAIRHLERFRSRSNCDGLCWEKRGGKQKKNKLSQEGNPSAN